MMSESTQTSLTLAADRAAGTVTLTTDHAASSYGQPVAVLDGQAYGPDDVFPGPPNDPLPWLTEPARHTIRCRAMKLGLRRHPLVERFCSV